MASIRAIICILVAVPIWQSSEGQHSLQRFSYPVNSDEYDEICPILSYNEDYLFFTRVGAPDHNRVLLYDSVDISKTMAPDLYEENLREIFYLISGKREKKAHESSYNQDIYYATSTNGIVSSVQHPDFPINSALPNSICSTYGPGGNFVIVNQFMADGSLMPGFSTVTFDGDSTFSWPSPIEILGYQSSGGAVNLSASANGEHLYLALEAPGRQGNYDLYYSVKFAKDLYTKPIRIPKVNTPYRESTPFISKDGQRLFFASNRPGGYGGMDVYVCQRTGKGAGEWSQPERLMAPLNSEFDDTHPYVAEDEETMLFNSNRLGSMDIFRVRLTRDSTLSQPIEVNIRILDATGQPVSGSINWSAAYDYESNFSGFFRTRDGHYNYTITENIPHRFYAERRTKTSQVAIVDPQELSDAGVSAYNLDLFLNLDGKVIASTIASEVSVLSSRENPAPPKPAIAKPATPSAVLKQEADNSRPQRLEFTDIDDSILQVPTKHTIQLQNIQFVKGKAIVLPSSQETLQQLGNVLLSHPHAVIQLEGHTDNVGQDDELKQLSIDRAESIKSHLVSQGVSPAAIRTIGFGKDHPLNANETEKDRKQNRRVEIRVLDSGKGKTK